MKAALLTGHGRPPVFEDRPDPQPAPGRMLVVVTAAPIVPLDLLCAGGTSYFGPPPLPYIPGVQGVGVVEQSDRLAPGSRVFFTSQAGMSDGDGSLAQKCSVADEDVIPIEHELPDAAVAAIGLSGVAAWMALHWRAGLQPGETVIVLGASGAVGQAAIGAARALGAGRVVAVCRSEQAAARVAKTAPDAIVQLPSAPDERDLAESLREACGGTADVVLDPVFGIAAAAAIRVLAEGGRLVNLGSASGDYATLSSAVLRSRSISVLGYTNNSLQPVQRADALNSVLGEAAAGRLAVVRTVLPLSDCAVGWQQAAASGPRVVLEPNY
jgi:NADPH:quinone reductase-like Zn-dependent oxidoreductase